MIYFTSDLHINHSNIISLCNRPYGNVEAMNEDIMTIWNNIVKPNDTVYMLGDMFFHNKLSSRAYINDYITRLNGRKILIQGNHDRDIRIYKRLDIPVFQEAKMIIAKKLCVLSHYLETKKLLESG
jgi:calcineurin-like phosphoesterase family protein